MLKSGILLSPMSMAGRYVRHYYEISYSDTLLIFPLKAVMPEKNREWHEIHHDSEELNREIKWVDQHDLVLALQSGNYSA